MNKNQELERIIKDNATKDVGEGHETVLFEDDIERAVQAILSAGYVKLSDVELDEEKIFETLFPFFNLVANNTDYPEKILQKMSIIIAQSAKEIVKVNQ